MGKLSFQKKFLKFLNIVFNYVFFKTMFFFCLKFAGEMKEISLSVIGKYISDE